MYTWSIYICIHRVYIYVYIEYICIQIYIYIYTKSLSVCMYIHIHTHRLYIYILLAEVLRGLKARWSLPVPYYSMRGAVAPHLELHGKLVAPCSWMNWLLMGVGLYPIKLGIISLPLWSHLFRNWTGTELVGHHSPILSLPWPSMGVCLSLFSQHESSATSRLPGRCPSLRSGGGQRDPAGKIPMDRTWFARNFHLAGEFSRNHDGFSYFFLQQRTGWDHPMDRQWFASLGLLHPWKKPTECGLTITRVIHHVTLRGMILQVLDMVIFPQLR